MVAELERGEYLYANPRGKRDRLEGGALNGHPKPAYGYVFIDTEQEAKARYDFNDQIISVDANGEEWTEVKVVRFMFELVMQGRA